MRVIVVEKNQEGQRLDKLLQKYLNKAPKSFIYKMLRKKNITLNGKKADGSEKTNLNDEIKLFLADETIDSFRENVSAAIVEGDLNIVYEDEHCLIINKSAGMLSQKAKPEDISLVEYVISYLLKTGKLTEEEMKTFKPGICNRLDRNTSGLVVAGKTLKGLQVMSELFRNRGLDKYYLCIVKGKVSKKHKLKGYLRKDEKTNKVMVLEQEFSDSEYIETEYEPVMSSETFTLLKVKLITGKTHQIRAHLSSIGHPIIGDEKYGDRKLNERMKKEFGLGHQLLHSYEVHFNQMEEEFKHLSGRTITGEVPKLFLKIQEKLSLR